MNQQLELEDHSKEIVTYVHIITHTKGISFSHHRLATFWNRVSLALGTFQRIIEGIATTHVNMPE